MRSTEESRKGSRLQLYWLELVLCSFISSCPRILSCMQNTVRSLGDQGSRVSVSPVSRELNKCLLSADNSVVPIQMHYTAWLWYHIFEILENVFKSVIFKHLWRLIKIRNPQKSNKWKWGNNQAQKFSIHCCKNTNSSDTSCCRVCTTLPDEGGLDCLSSLLSSAGLSRAWPYTAFIATWTRCWPKGTCPQLLKCRSHLNSMNTTYHCL